MSDYWIFDHLPPDIEYVCFVGRDVNFPVPINSEDTHHARLKMQNFCKQVGIDPYGVQWEIGREDSAVDTSVRWLLRVTDQQGRIREWQAVHVGTEMMAFNSEPVCHWEEQEEFSTMFDGEIQREREDDWAPFRPYPRITGNPVEENNPVEITFKDFGQAKVMLPDGTEVLVDKADITHTTKIGGKHFRMERLPGHRKRR